MTAVADDAPADKIDYAEQIKPLLANHCYACHGPDEKQRKAEMRLDVRAEAVKDAIIPGNAAESELIERITSDDPDVHMPPPKSKKPPLTPAQVELFRAWIDQGAEFEPHWAFVPPKRPEVPAVADTAWPAGDLDRFVLARLEKEHLAPSPEADRRTLLRRLSLDLTGLPPTPEEVDAFVADESPDAYERVVDRLLASQHYGERMAMYWLDLVRFADTNGIHGDNHREHAPYRDYVISAFNANMPFDRFTIEQLGGDLLPEPTRDQRIASGYNRLNMTTREGGAQPKEYIAKYAADRVRDVSLVWMGATLGCAECHNHKFDPYTQKDFYSLEAFFADVQETPVGVQQPTPVPTAEQVAERDALDARIAAVSKTLDTPTPELATAQATWEEKIAKEQMRWAVLKPTEAVSSGGAKLTIADDGAVLASGPNPATDTYTITAKTGLAGITAIRLEVLPHDSLPAKGPGRAANGNFVLNRLTLAASDVLGDPQPVPLQNATATHEQKEGGDTAPGGRFAIAHTIDPEAKDSTAGWAIFDQVGKANQAVFETQADVAGGKDTTLVFTLAHNYGSSHTIGRFRLSVTTAPRPVKAISAPQTSPEILAIVALPVDQRSTNQKEQLAAHYRTIAPLLADARQQLAAFQAEHQMLEKSFPLCLITTAVAPRMVRVLPRGNWLDDSGELVEPAVPEFLAHLDTPDRRATRLDLARWFVAPDNPLTARVMANRFWKLLFGAGLVTTLDDFGTQGAVPTHPKLLDWLATELTGSGWDVKHLMKQIVMSRSYRQTSDVSDELHRRDPANHLLARQNRFRLDAELVRDQALAASGLLVRKIGGASVKPYQPARYWAHLNFPQREYQNDTGENLYRRGLYTYWCRTFLHPSLLAFDAPTREECTAQRPRSNTPLQALVLLNDPIYVEAARVLAERAVREGGQQADGRLAFLMRQVLARQPSAEESAILAALYEKHLAEYRQDANAAREIIHVGQYRLANGIDPVELAAWTSVARVILNLHETITRY